MIRTYEHSDKEQIIEILEAGLELDMSYINNDLCDENSEVLVYADEYIKGFILLIQRNPLTNYWNIDIYVNPCDRNKGIGSKLYNEGLKYLKKRRANSLSTKYVDSEKSITDFYKKRGYKSWFSYYEMIYNVKHKKKNNIEFINYKDEYYEKYVDLISEGFYELRCANDIQPYVCYIPSEEDRKCLLKDSENIYLSIDDNNDIVSTVLINNGYIDELVVNKKYEGKGIGKETTSFAINNCINSKSEKICLDVVTWNTKAIYIYEKLGFELVQKFNVERQYLDKE